MKAQRNLSLDLVRSIAILLVFSNHLITNILKIDIGPFWYLAYLGVDIFFGLSGFLIGGILISICNDSKTGLSPENTFTFLVRRIFRTAPLYFFLLLINFCVCKFLLKNVYSFDWHFLFWMQNFMHQPASFFGESWSLCIEEWFYFSYSVLLCLFMILVKKWKISSTSKVVVFTVAYILFFTSLRFIYSDFNYADTKIVVFRLDSIAYGVLIAAFNQKVKLDNYKKAVGITGVFLLFIGTLIFLKNPFPLLHKFHHNFSGLGIAFCVWYIYKSSFSTYPCSKQITFISKTSYSIYLINLIAIYLVLHFSQFVMSNYSILVFGLVLVIALSHLTYKFVELPFLRFRDIYFPERRMISFR